MRKRNRKQQNLLELVSEFSKISRYNVNVLKAIFPVFQQQIIINLNIIYNSIKIIKYLINLTKEVQEFCTVNYKT